MLLFPLLSGSSHGALQDRCIDVAPSGRKHSSRKRRDTRLDSQYHSRPSLSSGMLQHASQRAPSMSYCVQLRRASCDCNQEFGVS